jgi:thymidylate synthase
MSERFERAFVKCYDEEQYMRLVDEIIEFGVIREGRAGHGTKSIFGAQMRFSLRNGKFPLLTTKKVFWRGIIEEMLWFINGSTSSTLLSDKGVKIWDANGSREKLDELGFQQREVGDLGPVYGFQWRHWGAEYQGPNADYAGKGIDQLAECIRLIKNNPNDRRIVMSAWNPSDLPKMALPPCHMFCQFYVANGELSCLMYQRSCDMGLGVPFNIASYALLTCMVAHVCGLKPGEFIHSLGDTHVYLNHIPPLKEQLTRQPMPFPTLQINPLVKEIGDFKSGDFHLEGYDPHPAIKMDMAV